MTKQPHANVQLAADLGCLAKEWYGFEQAVPGFRWAGRTDLVRSSGDLAARRAFYDFVARLHEVMSMHGEDVVSTFLTGLGIEYRFVTALVASASRYRDTRRDSFHDLFEEDE
jgi:hypothetical protein